MAQMSTSYIGSGALNGAITPITIPGFDVLKPTSYAEQPQTPTSTPLPSTPSTSPSSSSTSSSDGLNQYQQALANLEGWQNQVLQASLFGNTAAATNALYASAGLNADQFANLATELQNLGSTPAAGSTIDTSA